MTKEESYEESLPSYARSLRVQLSAEVHLVMLTPLAGDTEVVLQPIFWLLLVVLIVGGLITAVLFVIWLFAHWYWVERPSDEQYYRSEFWEERPLIEQISPPPSHKKLAQVEPVEQRKKERKKVWQFIKEA